MHCDPKSLRGESLKMDSKDSIQTKADKALKHAVRDLIKARQITNDTIVVWKNGRVARIPARKV